MKMEILLLEFQLQRDLREAKNQWAGYLTADTLSKVLEENRTINSSKEALSDDITEQNKAYAKKQGIAGIMDVIICAFSDYRDYNYYAPDHISDDEVGTIYERRISTLKNWLESGGETFSQAEKDFMIQKYEELKTPFYYEYIDGWFCIIAKYINLYSDAGFSHRFSGIRDIFG